MRQQNEHPPLDVRGLGKRYGSGAAELTVFAGLNLRLEAGDRVALTGESGTGKSTLLHLLGLLDAPTEGSIRISGRETGGLDEAGLAELRNREIGFVWQMNTLLPEFTALENVMMPLWIRGERKGTEEQAQALLREVGLGVKAQNLGGELSGGEQQRVVLARALAAGPRLLLADEPTGNLDERTGNLIMELLEAVHERRGLTTLYVTHNPAYAKRATKVLELRGGKLRNVGAQTTPPAS